MAALSSTHGDEILTDRGFLKRDSALNNQKNQGELEQAYCQKILACSLKTEFKIKSGLRSGRIHVRAFEKQA